MALEDVRIWTGSEYVSIAGPKGDQGEPGPQAVSTDAGNGIVIGSDGKVWADRNLIGGGAPFSSSAFVNGNQVTLNAQAGMLSQQITVDNVQGATITGNRFPTTTGTNGQVLTTNGAGVLSWSSITARSGFWVPTVTVPAGPNPVVRSGIWSRTGDFVDLTAILTGFTPAKKGVPEQFYVHLGNLPHQVGPNVVQPWYYMGSLEAYSDTFIPFLSGPSGTTDEKVTSCTLAGRAFTSNQMDYVDIAVNHPEGFNLAETAFKLSIRYMARGA